jgi:hypothetical protein
MIDHYYSWVIDYFSVSLRVQIDLNDREISLGIGIKADWLFFLILVNPISIGDREQKKKFVNRRYSYS